NQAGNQPRERDYAFAGSTYAFAVWIGLAVVALVRMARDLKDQMTFKNTVLYSGGLTLIVMLMSDANAINGKTFLAAIMGGIIASALTAILTYAVRAASSKGTNLRTGGIVSTIICLIAPIIMGAQEWDDHDRSQKTLAPDIAYDYLVGCPKNAILFTFGDNDTYPLWYAQEVEGVRPDVRIVNTSLLGIDWYVNQLRYKVNESPAFDVVLTEDQLRGFSYVINTGDKGGTTQPLYQFLKTTLGGQLNNENKSGLRIAIPSHLTVPVDVNYVKQSGLVKPTDSVLNQITLDISPNKTFFSLDQITMMSILASSNWRRPICFTSPYGEIGFGPYLRQIGLVYQIVPVNVNAASSQSLNMDVDKTKDILMTQFRGGNSNKPGVYFDEENRRHLLSIRATYAQAASNLADAGRKQEAVALLNRAETIIHPEGLPYAMVSRDNGHNRTSLAYLEAAYKAGDMDLIKKLKDALTKDFNDQLNYYKYLKDQRPEYYNGDLMDDEQFCNRALQQMQAFDKQYNPGAVNITEQPGKRADSLKRKDSTKK
ncbi:MAG: DUF2723 domain-containing protein, partial [Flavisolibacter sp.]